MKNSRFSQRIVNLVVVIAVICTAFSHVSSVYAQARSEDTSSFSVTCAEGAAAPCEILKPNVFEVLRTRAKQLVDPDPIFLELGGQVYRAYPTLILLMDPDSPGSINADAGFGPQDLIPNRVTVTYNDYVTLDGVGVSYRNGQIVRAVPQFYKTVYGEFAVTSTVTETMSLGEAVRKSGKDVQLTASYQWFTQENAIIAYKWWVTWHANNVVFHIAEVHALFLEPVTTNIKSENIYKDDFTEAEPNWYDRADSFMVEQEFFHFEKVSRQENMPVVPVNWNATQRIQDGVVAYFPHAGIDDSVYIPRATYVAYGPKQYPFGCYSDPINLEINTKYYVDVAGDAVANWFEVPFIFGTHYPALELNVDEQNTLAQYRSFGELLETKGTFLGIEYKVVPQMTFAFLKEDVTGNVVSFPAFPDTMPPKGTHVTVYFLTNTEDHPTLGRPFAVVGDSNLVYEYNWYQLGLYNYYFEPNCPNEMH